MNVPDSINKDETRILRNLVGIPSYFDPTNKIDERAVMEYAESELHDCCNKLWRMPVEHDREIWVPDKFTDTKREFSKENIPGRWNLIAEQGKGDFVIYIPVHLDTVKSRASLKLIEHFPDHLMGLGAWDMKAGAMMLIKLLQEAKIGPGIKLIGVFLVDEERDSLGARVLLDAIENGQLPRADLVLTPEIAANQMGNLDSLKLVSGRYAHEAFRVTVKGQEGHGSLERTQLNKMIVGLQDHIVEYIRAVLEKDWQRKKNLRHILNDRILPHLPGQETNKNLPQVPAQEDGYLSNINMAIGDWSYLYPHPKPKNPVIRHLQEGVAQWNQKKEVLDAGYSGSIEIVERDVQYPAFDLKKMGMQKHITAIRNCMKYLGIKFDEVTDTSTADSNLFVAKGMHAIDLGPSGQFAHGVNEIVYGRSIVNAMKVYREVLTGRHIK